jgi:hypothetical protein
MVRRFVACFWILTWPLAVSAHPDAHAAAVYFSELNEQYPKEKSLYIDTAWPILPTCTAWCAIAAIAF